MLGEQKKTSQVKQQNATESADFPDHNSCYVPYFSNTKKWAGQAALPQRKIVEELHQQFNQFC